MGCDIHVVYEIYTDNEWKYLPTPGEVFLKKKYGNDVVTRSAALKRIKEVQDQFPNCPALSGLYMQRYDKYIATDPTEQYYWDLDGPLDLGRNYNLFSILSDVRQRYLDYKHIMEIIPIATDGIPFDCSPEYNKKVESWNADGHSHGYIDLDTLLQFPWNTKICIEEDGHALCERLCTFETHCTHFVTKTIPFLQELELPPQNVRLCFFYDN